MKKLWFKYFSLLLTYPSETWLNELKMLEKELVEGEREIFKFSEYFMGLGLENLKQEYTNLFISSFPTLPCPPYESYYREGLLLGEASQEVLDYYSKKGYQFALEGEAPDHIAVEFEFLALTEDPLFLKRIRSWFRDFKECVKRYSLVYERVVNFIEEKLKVWVEE